MGDRAGIILYTDHTHPVSKKKEVECSPCLYVHWDGEEKRVEAMRKQLATLMANRLGDLPYGFARLVEIACQTDNNKGHSAGVGVYSCTVEEVIKDDAGQYYDNGMYYIYAKDWSMTRDANRMIALMSPPVVATRKRVVVV